MFSNVDGRDMIYSYDPASGRTEALPLPAGINSDYIGKMPAFSPDGSRILFPHQSGNMPLDYWILDRAAASRRRSPARTGQHRSAEAAENADRPLPQRRWHRHQRLRMAALQLVAQWPCARGGAAARRPDGADHGPLSIRMPWRWPRAATSTSPRIRAARPATARRFNPPTIAIWAAAIWSTTSRA